MSDGDDADEAEEAVATADDKSADAEQRLGNAVRYGVPAATLLGAVIAGLREGAGMAVLVLAGGALVAVIAIFWASIRTLLGETPLTGADAYAIGAPHAEEEQKRAVLRALKDLEFERTVGKISEEDYAELVGHYRAEAKRLLRVIDEKSTPRHEGVLQLLEERLQREGLLDREPTYRDAPKPAPKTKQAKAKRRRNADEAPTSAPPEEAQAAAEEAQTDPLACPACATINEPDAVFCKKCGVKRAEAT